MALGERLQILFARRADVKLSRQSLGTADLAFGAYMQIKDVRPESFIKQIRCDRCGRLSELGEVEFHESVSIDQKAGYASIFGDGNDVQVDLCQHCLKITLGPWLRVSDAADRRALLEERLLRLDPDQHGGGGPTAADVSLPVPMPMADDGTEH